ncbi:diguanylate cyclase domain-containing protein [Oceanisphaera avium]|uniref:Diguanylate cyclase n=1 Tax=Oceanisphaera avium TaxID=1903694 RepID=A0A1Y0D0T6_9GAMM|nr:diguanylate cyclase [Oceanisphaera avium]ART80625.1 hypothetical protein CBP12_11115 [Oceanisphaera avium]
MSLSSLRSTSDITPLSGANSLTASETDWQQLCQQVCVTSHALHACFVLFNANEELPHLFYSEHWPLLSEWQTHDYQHILQKNLFYHPLSKPNSTLKNYLAIPIKRGHISGLLLLHFSGNLPTLNEKNKQLLDTFAMHGALLFQANQPKLKHRRVSISRHLIQRFKKVLNQAATPISAFDASGKCVFWNLACERVFGWHSEEMTQHESPICLFYPEETERQLVMKEARALGRSSFKEWHPFNKAGQRLGILCTSISLTEGISLCICHDITEQKKWLKQQHLAPNVFESSYDGIIISDPNHRITHVNPAFTRITGFSAAEVVDRYPYVFKYLLSNPEFYHYLAAQLKVKDHWQGELNSQRKSGEDCALLLAITAVRDHSGNILNHVTVLSDITHLKQHEANLRHQAFHDALTGIPNRLLFSELLERAIYRCQRKQSQLAVCYLDLDGFKAINDNFGHAAGDALLIEISQRLNSRTRACDALARLGGDEFVLLCTEFESREECADILERIQAVIREPVLLEAETVYVSASIGVALYPDDADHAELLLRYADQAMYQAKKQSKDTYVFFDTLNK